MNALHSYLDSYPRERICSLAARIDVHAAKVHTVSSSEDKCWGDESAGTHLVNVRTLDTEIGHPGELTKPSQSKQISVR